ncbi:GGDEF domain-containing protein [Chitinimonas sp. BJB300]|uniref:GGDEF domain-containing protein n=1 Tax=Chitinimonas sp. BJB300 TaxID=1559339 RepID=UPI000C11FE14|nr:GGDEF domain-containing protein [Chitinimonas sp. BJB300]PHV11737.1 GGDEF domain-containing protein [Chitinimonas sp. BJB300]TSJ90014.1 GGDEF domain-containing protein [Chitinimonas sp. BJB300]
MTNKLSNPTDLAREALKLLTARRIPPTPERYEEVYYEIAEGKTGQSGFVNALATELLAALKAFPKQSPDLHRQISQIEKAAISRDWAIIPPILLQAIEAQGGQAGLARAWSELIRDLLNQWDLRSPHFSATRKRESLAKVLLNFGNYPSLLNEKLDALIRSWADGGGGEGDIEVSPSDVPNADSGVVPQALASVVLPPAAGVAAEAALDWQRWRDMLVIALRDGLAGRLMGYPGLVEEVTSLALAAESVSSEPGLDFLAQRLKRFWLQLALQTEQDERIATALVNLLLLLSDNLVDLSGADEWVRGQVEVVHDLLAKPLSINRLYQAEAGFKEVFYKQNMLKHNLDEAQEALRNMISLFIDRLGGMADSTGGYHTKIEAYTSRIAAVQGIPELNVLLDELMQDTRVMQLDMARSRDEIIAARTEAAAADMRITELESQLREVSEKIREDQLTGALNRRGFNEAFMAEIARAERSGKPLCLSLLDIDNFKKLNDQRGHQAGDDALVHLVKVIKEVLRPTDIVARYGGEEFVVLLPELVLSEAVSVMRRVQRELTRCFFLNNNERVLITFSAGITRYEQGEHPEATVERADHAMYEAKKSGKNQVNVADRPKNE